MEIRETKSRRDKSAIRQYILDCIDSDGYNVQADTEIDKLQFLRDTFKKEYGHNVLYYGGSWQNTFINWMKGLPSAFNIDFENYRIIELMKRWFRGTKTKMTEDKLLETYWALLYMEVNYLLKANKLPTLDE